MVHLLKNFYSILDLNTNGTHVDAKILLNVQHEIYKGHFPEVPVVPGVCQMQVVKEVLSDVLKKELTLIAADNMKFMAVINPEINSELLVTIDYKYTVENFVRITASIHHSGVVFFKYSGNFLEV